MKAKNLLGVGAYACASVVALIAIDTFREGANLPTWRWWLRGVGCAFWLFYGAMMLRASRQEDR